MRLLHPLPEAPGSPVQSTLVFEMSSENHQISNIRARGSRWTRWRTPAQPRGRDGSACGRLAVTLRTHSSAPQGLTSRYPDSGTKAPPWQAGWVLHSNIQGSEHWSQSHLDLGCEPRR